MKIKPDKKTVRLITIAILSYVNAIAMQYVTHINGDGGPYTGTQLYSFIPESVLWFIACFYLLNRFAEEGMLKKKGKLILSLVFGFGLAFTAVWGQEILYNLTLWDKPDRLRNAFFAALGLMIFTVPFISFITGLFDKASESCKKAENSLSEKPGKKKSVIYFLISLLVFFISYVPIFLWGYPINFFGDARDALNADYLLGPGSTHHSAIHWILMGKFYDFGVAHGSAAFGMQFFTLLQMAIMSLSFAYFVTYLFRKNIDKRLRITVYLICLLNPVHAYYSITAEKGTIGIALALLAMTILCEVFDILREGEKPFKNPFLYVKLFLFALIMSVGALFRNNMIYAIMAGGILIALLTKGLKNKAALLVLFALTFILFKAESGAIVKSYNLSSNDKYRETFAMPIMCLARVTSLHWKEMYTPDFVGILEYIPPNALEKYDISDHLNVKFYSNEEMLKKETGAFLRLFIKYGTKYPADYLDQIGWMVMGYFNPLYAHVLGGTTPFIYTPLDDEFMQIEHEDLLPIGKSYFEWMYYNDGRFRFPLFSLMFRPMIYTWITLYALAYGIYRKNRYKMSLSLIPFMYLGTILLGPICHFRYMYFNILFLGFELYVIISAEGKMQGENK